MARSKPRKNPLRLNLRRLLGCGVFLLAAGAGIFTWHHFAPPETREKIEAATLDAIDLARENRSTPRELVFWLDLIADKIPLTRGKVVAPGAAIEADAMVLGGTPAARERLVFLENKGYLAGYDEQRRNPAWVAYRVFPPKYKAAARPEKFKPDPRTRAKVDATAYTNSGYDRGHMAPNHAIAVCHGPEAQRETFLMTNVAPQLHGLNGALWKALEERVLDRYTRRYGDVWVVCGPVYEKGREPRRIGENVAVPDAFFLVISERDERSGGLRTLAFLVPHRELRASEDPSKYLVSVREIEARAGLDFFPKLPRAAQDALETTAAKRAW
jgi:endonuclease G